jgi:hypothetical protein
MIKTCTSTTYNYTKKMIIFQIRLNIIPFKSFSLLRPSTDKNYSSSIIRIPQTGKFIILILLFLKLSYKHKIFNLNNFFLFD